MTRAGTRWGTWVWMLDCSLGLCQAPERDFVAAQRKTAWQQGKPQVGAVLHRDNLQQNPTPRAKK